MFKCDEDDALYFILSCLIFVSYYHQQYVTLQSQQTVVLIPFSSFLPCLNLGVQRWDSPGRYFTLRFFSQCKKNRDVEGNFQTPSV